jgi:ATP/maltotriose-dependent transcriptional regulator MalT
MLNPLACLYAMKGDLDRAEAFLQQTNAVRQELGHVDTSVSHLEAMLRLLAGRPDLAEIPLRAGVEKLGSTGDSRMLATTHALLARAMYAQAQIEEAHELCAKAARAAADDDIFTQVLWRGVQAMILARDGRTGEAETLAREAVALVEPTDMLTHRGDAMLDLAEVLASCSRPDESERAMHTAVAMYEMKGNAVAAARARSLLAELRG